MKLVIPVAGMGTRLQPHTFSKPKSLMSVAGKPILGHILDMFKGTDFEEVIFITGNMGEKIQLYVNSHYSFKTRFVLQKEPLGLGHAIYQAAPFFGNSPVLIILGDTILDLDFRKFALSKKSVLGVKRVDTNARRFGVAFTDKNGTVKKLVEKPDIESGLALVGIYLIKNGNLLFETLRKMVNHKQKKLKEYQLTDALQKMIENGESFSTTMIDGWFDCGGMSALLATNRYLLPRNARVPDHIGKRNIIIQPVNIHESCEVFQSIIGPYTTIAEGSRITKCQIANSIIEDNAVVSECLLEDSIIGSNAVLKGNKINLNLGHSSVVELG
ncbi:MAG: sugar phosphate nucleotidyltransferase [Chitinivibrionales bacterium]